MLYNNYILNIIYKIWEIKLKSNKYIPYFL